MNCRAVFAIIVICLFSFTAATQENLEKAAEAARLAYQQAETSEQALEIIRDFLSSHPESKHTMYFLQRAARIIGNDLGDSPGAIAYVKDIAGKLQNSGIKAGALYLLVDLYAHPGYGDLLKATADEISSLTDIRFDNYSRIIRAAISAGEWGAVLDYASKASEYANVESIRADNSGRSLDDERINIILNNRLGGTAMVKGWALSKLYRYDEALAALDEAEKLVERTYFGTNYDNVWLYQGLTLAEMGEFDLALDKLIPFAMYERSVSGQAYGKILEIYTLRNRTPTGFDDYLKSTRVKYAKTIDDFEMKDYDGNTRKFSELMGEKATILTWWSPN